MGKMCKRKIHIKLLSNIALIVLFFVILFFVNMANRKNMLQNSQKLGNLLAESYSERESEAIQNSEILLDTSVRFIMENVTEAGFDDELKDAFIDMCENSLGKEYTRVYAITNGMIYSIVHQDGVPIDMNNEWIKKTLMSDGVVSFTRQDMKAGFEFPIVTITKKCGNTGIIIAVDFSLERIAHNTSAEEISKNSSYFLLDEKGEILFYKARTETAHTYDEYQEHIRRNWDGIKDESFKEYNRFVIDLDGEKRNIFYSRLDNGWYYVLTVPNKDILGKATYNFYRSLLFAIIAFVFVGAFTIRDLRNEIKRQKLADERNKIAYLAEMYEKAVSCMALAYSEIYFINLSTRKFIKIYPLDGEGNVEESYVTAIQQHISEGVICNENIDDVRKFLAPESIKRALREKDYVEMKYRRADKNGDPRWCLTSITASERIDGEPITVTMAIKQIDDVVRQEEAQKEALQIAAQNANMASLAKSEFLSKISHDIRTPMNAMLGMTALALIEIDDKERVRDNLEAIAASGEHLLGLINEVLDMSKIESGKLALIEHSFRISELFSKLLKMFELQIQAKNIDFQIVSKEIINDSVVGDDQKLFQIFVNILGNAVKYTNEGGKIYVTATENKTVKNNLRNYVFTFSDSGIGMTDELMTHIFEPFYRGAEAENSEICGTGLGMSIAYGLAKLMGGDITVASIPDKGSCFTVSVYLKLQEETAEQKTDYLETINTFKRLDFTGKKALVVDDNEMNITIIRDLLRYVGMEVEAASEGKQAVEILRNSPENSINIVFMDVHMPGMDGYSATEMIRADEREWLRKVPIIAMTADAFEDDVKKAQQLGMNGHISKPVRLNRLSEVLTKFLVDFF